jgi:transcriptional regulator with XRE-family HTH domain
MDEIPKNIDGNEARQADQWSIASAMGLSAPYLSDIRRGRRKISATVIQKLQKIEGQQGRL